MKTATRKAIETAITPTIEAEYLQGTLPGFLSCNPNFGLLHIFEYQLYDLLAKRTGKRITQRQRGATIWE